MALTNLGDVTKTLKQLLELNIPRIDPGVTMTVDTLPPERVGNAQNVLNLHCYHVSENEHRKLLPRQSGGRAIATSPLSLVMHYILTAHSSAGTSFDSLAEQRLLGLGMKTFHDYPLIEDGSLVGTDVILPFELQGRDNRFEITMVQMGAREALDFWANEDQTTAKPSAYYEVRPVDIASDPPERVPGIVLTLGNFVFPIGAPSIGASESELTYTLPTALGGGTVTSAVSPGKVGPANPSAPPTWNALSLKGAGLDRGQRQTLFLTNSHWSTLYPDLPRVPVDMGQNGPLGWSQTLADGAAEIMVGDEIDIPRPDGTFDRLAMYPGTYIASWQVELLFDQPDGTPRFVNERSNDVAFTVNPRIVGFARDAGSGEVTLDLGGVWLLDRGRPPPTDPVREPELDILLSVDGVGYRLRRPGDATDLGGPGTFTIASHQLTYEPEAAANSSGLHTIRVLVNGADTQPFWIEIP